MNKSVRVFLGEDDADDSALFDLALREIFPDSELHTSDNGENLIQLLNSIEVIPDIIFLDINMPLKTGLECLIELRQMKHLNQVPIIMLSTSADDTYVSKAFQNGADLYVQKPNLYQELKEMLSACIGKFKGKRKKIFFKSFLILNVHTLKS